MSLCQAEIQQGPHKGELCGNTSNGKYCSKHIRHTIIDKANIENISYCDISRGCYTVLEEHQSKCTHCLQKARITDRKREDKKRQDSSLCLDCGTILTNEIRAKGKHDKSLRRCIICYEKLLKVESQRDVRERNYKAEVFTNKHVIWNHYVKSAKARGINFIITKALFNDLIIQNCFYCNYKKQGEVNGIDRIDNNKGYVDDNIVTCCQNCNTMKGSQHPQEFIDKLQAIYNFKVTYNSIEQSTIDKWKTTYLSKITPNYKIYKKSANSRNIEFNLSEEEFSNIIKQSCYMCGIPTLDINNNGIDRFDNTKGYILDNCRPCCGHCNILKNKLVYSIIIEIAKNISYKYDEITLFLNNKDITVRNSKVEPRIKIDNPIVQLPENRIYKPINEIIEPNKDIPLDIKILLEKEVIDINIPKQWKVKQIYDTIQVNNESLYKTFCEENNDIIKIPDWDINWVTFILSVKGKTLEDSEKTIRDFIENLRRIRHNDLCYDTNAKVVDRDNRQQWPATTIVRAYLDGKIETFKKFTEEQTGDNPEELVWQKRWDTFIISLNKNRNNSNILKELCSKFLTAQRIKRYRQKKE